MKKRVLWRIYYENETTFSSLEGKPFEAPPYGFVCVVFPDHDKGGNTIGRYIMHGWDYYFWQREYREWWGCNLTGLLDRLASRLPTEAVCIGRTVHSTLFRELMGRADRDPDFTRKSALARIETPFRKEGPETKAMIADGA